MPHIWNILVWFPKVQKKSGRWTSSGWAKFWTCPIFWIHKKRPSQVYFETASRTPFKHLLFLCKYLSDYSDNPGYAGVKFHTFYESHLSVWGAFQGAWSCGAWTSLSLKPFSFFSCCKTDRALPHPNICYADAWCQAPCNAHRYACTATRCLLKEVSCP